MLARIWPPVTYWLEAPDEMVATALQLIEEEANRRGVTD